MNTLPQRVRGFLNELHTLQVKYSVSITACEGSYGHPCLLVEGRDAHGDTLGELLQTSYADEHGVVRELTYRDIHPEEFEPVEGRPGLYRWKGKPK